MLMLSLLVASSLQVTEPTVVPDTVPPPACNLLLRRVAEAQGTEVPAGARLYSDRQGRIMPLSADPGVVRLHYLVDRRVGGCPVAVVNPALGISERAYPARELGRSRRSR